MQSDPAVDAPGRVLAQATSMEDYLLAPGRSPRWHSTLFSGAGRWNATELHEHRDRRVEVAGMSRKCACAGVILRQFLSRETAETLPPVIGEMGSGTVRSRVARTASRSAPLRQVAHLPNWRERYCHRQRADPGGILRGTSSGHQNEIVRYRTFTTGIACQARTLTQEYRLISNDLFPAAGFP